MGNIQYIEGYQAEEGEKKTHSRIGISAYVSRQWSTFKLKNTGKNASGMAAHVFMRFRPTDRPTDQPQRINARCVYCYVHISQLYEWHEHFFFLLVFFFLLEDYAVTCWFQQTSNRLGKQLHGGIR